MAQKTGWPSSDGKNSIRHFPARLLTPDEHALLAEWLSAAGDIASAYVSNRRGDDPAYDRDRHCNETR